MKIVGWTWCDNPDYKDMYPIGEPDNYDGDPKEVVQIIADELRRCGYKFTGHYHQNGDYGVPLFDNGMVYTCSQRSWGAIIAKAYPEDDYPKEGFAYVKWAWLPPEGENMVIPDFVDGRYVQRVIPGIKDNDLDQIE